MKVKTLIIIDLYYPKTVSNEVNKNLILNVAKGLHDYLKSIDEYFITN
jgi:hypothetical protein